jgi:hypothetical protein
MDKDRSSSRRCGNEEIERIARQGCVSPVHLQTRKLRIGRIKPHDSLLTADTPKVFLNSIHRCTGSAQTYAQLFNTANPGNQRKKNAPNKIGAFQKLYRSV